MATPEEIAAAKEGLTGDQLKWLGNADPTDPFIRARGGLPPLPNQITVPGQSDVKTAEKYIRSETVGAIDEQPNALFYNEEYQSSLGNIRIDNLASKGINKGAEKLNYTPATTRIVNTNGTITDPDIRVKIIVPEEYLNTNYSPGVQFLKRQFHGIIFPYTPLINYEVNANYTPQNPIHSNYTQNFYQRSSVSNISISGKFTVQNREDAAIYLGTTHLISALTKMKFGDDFNAGAPPPICSLNAYGTYMLKNVPIAISSFKIDLPDSVDYYIFDDVMNKDNVTSVPVLSTISITCAIMYSRREIQNFSVDRFITSYAEQKKLGYL